MPPTTSATEQLRALIGLPRYLGMDAWAQSLADDWKLDRGPYAKAVSCVADTPAEAYTLISSHGIDGYTRVGIGLHNDYWIVVLS